MKHLVVSCVLLLTACASTYNSIDDLEDIPLKAVPHVDLQRYMGRWYMIANIPYFAERGNVGVYVDYRLREDGLIEDRYSAQGAFDRPRFTRSGEIEVQNGHNNAEGRITFLPFPGQDFTVLYLDSQYQYTLIGHPSRNYCWLFARAPDMPDHIYADMQRVLEANLFDIKRVLKIPQRPDQIGASGFQ